MLIQTQFLPHFIKPPFFLLIELGYSFFWKYDAFETIGMTFRSMWALSCGDIVHDTFLSMIDEGYMKQLWIFAFMILFYTGAANLLYAIMMEGYDRA